MVPLKDTKFTSPPLLRLFSIIAGLAAFAAVTATIDDIGVTIDEPTIIGGLLISTIITLVTVPLLYTFFDNLRAVGSKVAADYFSRKNAE